jgi:hypothetical protein
MIVKPDQVFMTNILSVSQGYRRIIAVFGDYVYYSVGSDVTKACLHKTFKRWVRSNNVSVLIKGV